MMREPICSRYLYCLVFVIIFIIATLDIGFRLFPTEPVSHYIVIFFVSILICELFNLLKWIWFRYLW
jgi:hypothetical protein